jgi:hypothetical protein
MDPLDAVGVERLILDQANEAAPAELDAVTRELLPRTRSEAE